MVQSKLESQETFGAENATEKSTEIEELEGKGTREEIKLKERARDSQADLPGVAE